jgi:beta-galactosidase
VGDKAGLNVIDAAATVTVHVEGGGRLIGLDTGDLIYDGMFKTDTRNTYQGRLLVTVQRTAQAGEMRLMATAPGLTTASIQAK